MKPFMKLTLAGLLLGTMITRSGAQQPGFEVSGVGFGSQQRIIDTVSKNSLVLQSGAGSNLKITGFNYNTGTAQPLYLSTDGANTFLNTSGGSVGIGTTSPMNRLDVNGYTRAFNNVSTGFIAQTTGGTNAWARTYFRSNAQSWYIGTSQAFNDNMLYVGDETNSNIVRFSIRPNGPIFLQGSVGVNTINTTGYALAVNGNIRSKEVIVQTNWADYVFEKDYPLMSLAQVENFIHQHGHLPNIPPAVEVEEHGLALGDIQRRMMEKIEELTLHLIRLQKELDSLKKSH